MGRYLVTIIIITVTLVSSMCHIYIVLVALSMFSLFSTICPKMSCCVIHSFVIEETEPWWSILVAFRCTMLSFTDRKQATLRVFFCFVFVFVCLFVCFCFFDSVFQCRFDHTTQYLRLHFSVSWMMKLNKMISIFPSNLKICMTTNSFTIHN